MRHTSSGWWAVVGSVGLLASCKGTEPLAPTTIDVTPSASISFATINRTLQLSASVLDQHGAVLPGVKVTWASGNSFVVTVDTNGLLRARGNGSTTVTVSAGNATKPVTVIVAQAAALLIKSSGDQQSGPASGALGAPVAVQVIDSLGNFAANVSVSFAVTAGGGSVFPVSANTNASGIATTGWTLGASGTQSVSGSAAALSTSFTGHVVPAVNPSGFQITVINVGPPLDPVAQAAFDSAAAFWQRAITGDLPDYANFSAAAGDCGPGWPAVGPLTVDDVIILARLDSIDGPGQILGSAGPCYVRVSGSAAPFSLSFPLLGIMRFDTADVRGLINNGLLAPVIRHEMAHVLGFGSYWPAAINSSLNGFGCLKNPSSTTSAVDTYYDCARAKSVFDSIGGTSYTGGNKVPVENCKGIPNCGQGTFNSHWRDSTFVNELMTGIINPGSNPLSVLSLAAMQDLGYTVNLSAADPYSHTFTSSPAMSAGALTGGFLNLGDDIAHIPIYAVDRRGRLMFVIRPR